MADLHSDQTEINRRLNALELARRAGSKAKFAARIGRSPGQINQTIGPSPRKNIGKSLAREIENAFGMPAGWLDQDHAGLVPTADELAEAKQVFANFDDGQAVEVVKAFLSRLDQRHQVEVLRHLAAVIPENPSPAAAVDSAAQAAEQDRET
jgi:hypothetical protein